MCSAALIFSVPYTSLATTFTFEEKVSRLQKSANEKRAQMDEKINKLERKITLKKSKLEPIYEEIGNLQKEIDSLLKQSENEKVDENIVLKINSIKNDLAKEKDNFNGCREVLDSLTAMLLSNEQGEDDAGLLLSKSIAQENFDKSSKKIQELEDELTKLEVSKYDCNDLKVKLEKLTEKKLQHEKKCREIKEKIEQCEKKYNNLVVGRKDFEDYYKRVMYDYIIRLNQASKQAFVRWSHILSGDQNENNVLDGQKIENACCIFAAANLINYYVCSYDACDGVGLIQGFNNVIHSYLSHGGKKENLNKVLGYEELKEYLNKFKFRKKNQEKPKVNEDISIKDEKFIEKPVVSPESKTETIENEPNIEKISPINTYNLVYEERVCNIPNLEEEIKKQEENITNILVKHFKSRPFSILSSPVLRLHDGHWQTFVAYDPITNRILLVDSSPAKVEWVDFDDVVKNSISVHEDKLHWGFVFSGLAESCGDDYFGIDLGNPFTEEQKARVIKNVSCCFV